MSRMIDADKLIKDILDLQDCYNGFSDTYDKACIIGVVDEQPTIEKRKKGRWINVHISVAGDSDAECNLCRAVVHTSFSDQINYCPNCGADMRGET